MMIYKIMVIVTVSAFGFMLGSITYKRFNESKKVDVVTKSYDMNCVDLRTNNNMPDTVRCEDDKVYCYYFRYGVHCFEKRKQNDCSSMFNVPINPYMPMEPSPWDGNIVIRNY